MRDAIAVLAASEPEKRQGSLPETLTRREVEVWSLLGRGRNNREIARSLVISPGTAKLHVHRVVKKLRVSDRTQAAIRAIELGLVAPRR